MAGITENVLMQRVEVLDSTRNLERLDFVARRNYRLENLPADSGPLKLSIPANHSAVHINRT